MSPARVAAPSEAELIEIEGLLGSYGSMATGWTEYIERTEEERIVATLRRLIEFARERGGS